MFDECKKCQGALIAGVSFAVMLHCPVDLKKNKCPYLPPEQHNHQEVYIPPEYSNLSISVATSGSTINHPYLIDSYDDKERPGFTIHIIDVTSNNNA